MPETTRYVFALVNNIVSSQFSTPYSIVKHIIRVDILRAELRSIFPSPVGLRKIASNEPNVTEHPFWME